MAAAPENDILTHLSNVENAIIPILENLRGEDVQWDNVSEGITAVRVMIQNIIDHNDEHRDILNNMIDAVDAAALAVNPQNPRLDRYDNPAIIALQGVIDLINDLRSQHVGGYRKRKRTYRKHRTQRKRKHRKRTRRNRK